MAGDWIKFELATIDKPEVLEMADLLNTTSDDVVGKLLRVWGWFDQQTRNGNAGSVTGNVLMRFIDRLVASQGFAACMKKVGWLDDSGIPNFDRHNGESSKKRALTNNRVKRSRNGDSVTKALPEKRREEIAPIVPTAVLPPAGFMAFWGTYPAHRRVGRAKCLAIWVSKRLEARAAEICLHVEAMKLTPAWQKDDGQFIPTSQTYLNQGRFDDGTPEAPARRLAI